MSLLSKTRTSPLAASSPRLQAEAKPSFSSRRRCLTTSLRRQTRLQIVPRLAARAVVYREQLVGGAGRGVCQHALQGEPGADEVVVDRDDHACLHPAQAGGGGVRVCVCVCVWVGVWVGGWGSGWGGGWGGWVGGVGGWVGGWVWVWVGVGVGVGVCGCVCGVGGWVGRGCVCKEGGGGAGFGTLDRLRRKRAPAAPPLARGAPPPAPAHLRRMSCLRMTRVMRLSCRISRLTLRGRSEESTTPGGRGGGGRGGGQGAGLAASPGPGLGRARPRQRAPSRASPPPPPPHTHTHAFHPRRPPLTKKR